jgi:DNA helicase-2/ATP-dependent DNA helicase PcrA
VEGVQQREDAPSDILSKFLANVTLSSAADQEGGDGEQVTISTIHAAKGLEWPIVFMPAMYDGSIPHSRADDHDEERRLLYVGMTRAQGLLYLSCPVKQAGQEKTTLSRFISEKKVLQHFSERGPDFAFKKSTIPDLARILRRECPTIGNIIAARSLVERLEDDFYPATRDEIDGDDSTWGASHDDKFQGSGPSSDRSQTYSKRRKLDGGNDSVATTMNKTSGFSMASTTMHGAKAGFTSARDLGDLQAMQREAERVRMLATAQDVESGRKAYKDDKRVEAKPAMAKKTKPRAAGQGAITNFFAKRSVSTPSDVTEQFAPVTMPSLQRSQSSISSNTPLSDISNVRPSVVRQPQPFQPLSVPSYMLQNRPMASKPKRSEPSPERSRYVLLSSSPVKAPFEEQPQNEEAKKDEQEPTAQSSSTTSSGFRSASTFHTTSMSQVQNQAAQRKTLGTRRTMQGWSVKHNAMPKPRPS